MKSIYQNNAYKTIGTIAGYAAGLTMLVAGMTGCATDRSPWQTRRGEQATKIVLKAMKEDPTNPVVKEIASYANKSVGENTSVLTDDQKKKTLDESIKSMTPEQKYEMLNDDGCLEDAFIEESEAAGAKAKEAKTKAVSVAKKGVDHGRSYSGKNERDVKLKMILDYLRETNEDKK